MVSVNGSFGQRRQFEAYHAASTANSPPSPCLLQYLSVQSSACRAGSAARSVQCSFNLVRAVGVDGSFGRRRRFEAYHAASTAIALESPQANRPAARNIDI